MSSTIPPIADRARRVLRTVVQVAIAFASLAAFVPVVEPLFGAPHSSNIAEYAAAAGLWVTTIAGIITTLMGIPAVDRVLTVFGVGSLAPSRVQIVVRDAAAKIDEVLKPLAPVLDAAVPVAAPEINTLEDIAAAVGATPIPDPAPAAPEVPATTETLALSAPRPATAGGQ